MNDWAEFRHFKYLLAIAEYRGFRAAAEHLHTAEPNLSVQAKQFQEMFGIRLFEKNPRGRVQLTETGIAFIRIARGLLQARDDAIAALIAIERSEIHSLSLGSASCLNRELFTVAREIHTELVPNCSIRPVHAASPELLEELIAGNLDGAIVTSPVEDQRLHVEEIVRERVVVCIPADHPLAKKPILEAKDLQNLPVVRCDPQRNPVVHAQLTAYMESAGIGRREYARASHPAEVRTLVRDGYGFALVREGTTADSDLVERPVAGSDWVLGSSFVYSKNQYSKTIPILVQQLKQHFAVDSPDTKRHMVQDVANPAQLVAQKRPPRSEDGEPEQLSLLG
jgi:DNA-binding transcriptional LysR family regulator